MDYFLGVLDYLHLGYLYVVTDNLLKLLDNDRIKTSVKAILNVTKGKLLNDFCDLTKDFEMKIILTTGSLNTFKKIVASDFI